MTAVEWLQESLSIHFSFEQKMQFEGLFQQAKEIEKEQIISAFYDGCFDTNDWRAEDYYNQKFEKK